MWMTCSRGAKDSKQIFSWQNLLKDETCHNKGKQYELFYAYIILDRVETKQNWSTQTADSTAELSILGSLGALQTCCCILT